MLASSSKTHIWSNWAYGDKKYDVIKSKSTTQTFYCKYSQLVRVVHTCSFILNELLHSNLFIYLVLDCLNPWLYVFIHFLLAPTVTGVVYTSNDSPVLVVSSAAVTYWTRVTAPLGLLCLRDCIFHWRSSKTSRSYKSYEVVQFNCTNWKRG